ncbi:NADPH-dependent F420 reductase [Curtobacterium citreum]|uniref:NADPH-dependent F420 reductase n=1 Tax=Curtobacterium citreum TaxID=2036 RepID=UPI0007378C0D|nr:NAD(P)-binding domain-containing protein [Curtobacterium citreum]KTR17096.1 NADP oxidoreductase [Curtobacterium citreum]
MTTTSSITIAVLGSGRVGSTLATGLAAAGHEVTLGVRNPGTAQHDVLASDVATAIETSGLIVNATPGDTTLERLVGHRDALAGKVLLDVSNATVRSTDGLPGGLLYPDVSLGELLQDALPDTKVVKTLNTMLFSVMTAPGNLTAPPTAFVSGDDVDAKRLVRTVLQDLGWDDDWILDLGGISTARGTEAMALMVPSLLGALGFVPFALTVAR